MTIGSLGRTYDNDFRVTSLSVNGSPVAYSYDADGLITGAGNLAVSRDARNGLITGATLGGIATANTFNAFGELASERHTEAGATLFDVQYTRDKLGRLTAKTETVGGVITTFGYLYDTAGRLVQVTKDGAVVSAYAYDQNGNRIGKTDAIGTTAGTHDAQDRLLTWGTNAYSYTANGEPLTKTTPAGTTSYTYDVLGNLVSATLPDGTVIEYIVDGANRRVGKKVNGVLTQGWLYANQLNPVAELDGAGNVISTFVYGTKGNVPDYVIKNGVTYRIISDHLGSPRLVESIGEFFPQASWQRCVVHFHRNAFTAIPRGKMREVAAMLKAIHAQEDRQAALEKVEAVARKLDVMKLKGAVKILREGGHETLSYYSFPSTAIPTKSHVSTAIRPSVPRTSQKWTVCRGTGGRFPVESMDELPWKTQVAGFR